MLMILAGYETTGNSMIFLAYNLAAYPEVQEKLRKEIDETLEKNVRTCLSVRFSKIVKY